MGDESLDFEPRPGRPATALRFPVRSHPRWKGRISELRLRIAATPGRPIVLREILAGRLEVVPERLTEALAKSWLVDFGGDVRNALVQPPGTRLARQIPVSARSHLRFSYGIPHGMTTPVAFRVTAARGEDDRDADGKEIFYDEVNPDLGESGRWLEARVEVGDPAGEEVELRFTTELARGAGGRKGPPVDLEEGLPAWANPRWVRDSHRAASGRTASKPNVVLISVDTLRADRLSLYGYPRQTSPRLDEWAASQGIVFRNAIASAPWTIPSHVSMFTGLDAHRHGVNHRAPAPVSLVTLAERLRQAGYGTLAVTGGGLLDPGYGLAQGFDLYRYWTEPEDRSGELRENLSATLDLLTGSLAGEEPFFLFFHTYEVHAPYTPRQPYFTGLSGRRPEVVARPWARPRLTEDRHLPLREIALEPIAGGERRIVPPDDASLASDLYDAGVAFMDGEIHRLLTHLDEAGLLERTLVVFTSDHGEMLGEHGLVGHGYLYDENLRVPLVLDPPGDLLPGGTVHEEQVRSVDLVPTILDWVGLGAVEGLDGISLLPWLVDGDGPRPGAAYSYAASSHHGLAIRVRNRLKLIFRNSVWPPHRGFAELYFLDRDPEEEHNRSGESEEEVRLRNAAIRQLETVSPGLRVAFDNPSDRVFTGTLAGGIDPEQVKSTDLRCECLSRDGPDTLGFHIRPRQRFTLLLENVQSPNLRLRLDSGSPDGPLQFALDLESLEDRHRLELDGDRWRVGAIHEGGSAPKKPSVELWWTGDIDLAEVSPEHHDPRLEKQLRALGYIQ